jgi:hypothetical protein
MVVWAGDPPSWEPDRWQSLPEGISAPLFAIKFLLFTLEIFAMFLEMARVFILATITSYTKINQAYL